jgi:hypothetical protein
VAVGEFESLSPPADVEASGPPRQPDTDARPAAARNPRRERLERIPPITGHLR